MPRTVFRLSVVIFLYALLSTSATMTANAYTKSPHISEPCKYLQVYLHGMQSATTKCLDSKVGKRDRFGIIAVPCDANSLILWFDANFSGPTLCFKGAGATDLTSYCYPWYLGGCAYSWNDTASSFAPGCSSGKFYIDIGEEGQSQTFTSSTPRANFDGQGGRLPNDSLSSVRLYTNC